MGERIVFLSTHVISVKAAATQIALVRQGRLLRCETPDVLLSASGPCACPPS